MELDLSPFSCQLVRGAINVWTYSLHKEQMEKWQEEIKELRLLDVTNEEANVVLTNAKYLLQNPDTDS